MKYEVSVPIFLYKDTWHFVDLGSLSNHLSTCVDRLLRNRIKIPYIDNINNWYLIISTDKCGLHLKYRKTDDLGVYYTWCDFGLDCRFPQLLKDIWEDDIYLEIDPCYILNEFTVLENNRNIHKLTGYEIE